MRACAWSRLRCEAHMLPRAPSPLLFPSSPPLFFVVKVASGLSFALSSNFRANRQSWCRIATSWLGCGGRQKYAPPPLRSAWVACADLAPVGLPPNKRGGGRWSATSPKRICFPVRTCASPPPLVLLFVSLPALVFVTPVASSLPLFSRVQAEIAQHHNERLTDTKRVLLQYLTRQAEFFARTACC